MPAIGVPSVTSPNESARTGPGTSPIIRAVPQGPKSVFGAECWPPARHKPEGVGKNRAVGLTYHSGCVARVAECQYFVAACASPARGSRRVPGRMASSLARTVSRSGRTSLGSQACSSKGTTELAWNAYESGCSNGDDSIRIGEAETLRRCSRKGWQVDCPSLCHDRAHTSPMRAVRWRPLPSGVEWEWWAATVEWRTGRSTEGPCNDGACRTMALLRPMACLRNEPLNSRLSRPPSRPANGRSHRR